MQEESKKIKWYQRQEVWGTALTVLSFSPDIINSFVDAGILPEYTLVAKIATPIGLILTALGLRNGHRDKNLPSGLSKVGEKIDTSINKFRNK